jgi:hypothetical protein
VLRHTAEVDQRLTRPLIPSENLSKRPAPPPLSRPHSMARLPHVWMSEAKSRLLRKSLPDYWSRYLGNKVGSWRFDIARPKRGRRVVSLGGRAAADCRQIPRPASSGRSPRVPAGHTAAVRSVRRSRLYDVRGSWIRRGSKEKGRRSRAERSPGGGDSTGN